MWPATVLDKDLVNSVVIETQLKVNSSDNSPLDGNSMCFYRSLGVLFSASLVGWVE